MLVLACVCCAWSLGYASATRMPRKSTAGKKKRGKKSAKGKKGKRSKSAKIQVGFIALIPSVSCVCVCARAACWSSKQRSSPPLLMCLAVDVFCRSRPRPSGHGHRSQTRGCRETPTPFHRFVCVCVYACVCVFGSVMCLHV